MTIRQLPAPTLPILRYSRQQGILSNMSEATQSEAPQLPKHKVKYKKAFQRACNELDEKEQAVRRAPEALVLLGRRAGANLRRRSPGLRRQGGNLSLRALPDAVSAQRRGAARPQCRRPGPAVGLRIDPDLETRRARKRKAIRPLSAIIQDVKGSATASARHQYLNKPAWLYRLLKNRFWSAL